MKYFTACFLLLLAFAVNGEEAKVPHVTIQTSFGPIEIELNPIKAPESVETFLAYVKEGFYEGTIFHRVINNFVVQGGGYTVDFNKKDIHPSIPNEAANGLKNLRGTVALARSNDPHSANSQFFINVRDNKFLDYKSSTTAGWGYCVFGKVIEGMEVVDKIAKTPTDSGGPFKRDVPQTTITIDAVKVEYVAPTDWVISAGGPDKPATEKKPTSEEKKKPEPSMVDMQQDMLSMDMEEEGKSPAVKDKSGSASSSKPTGDKSPQETKPAEKATDQADDQAETDDQTADTKVGKVATPVEAKTKVHHEAKTDKKPVTEKTEKPKTVVADDEMSEEDMSKDTAEAESEPVTTSDKKKMPAGTDKKSAEVKPGKEAKAHDEDKVVHKPVPEKQAKPKTAVADEMSEEDMSEDTAEADSEPATASEKKIPAGTDKKSSEAKTGNDSKAHNEAKTGLKPAPEKQAKPKTAATDDTQEKDISSSKDEDTEEADSELASASDQKIPGAGTDKKPSDAKTGKESKATIEKKPPTVTKTNEKDTSEQTALEEEPAPKGAVKTEHSTKTTPAESSSPNQPLTKAELENKAVASIEERTAEKIMVKPGSEKTSVGKASGKTTPPPDKPTPPDKPEPVAY